MNENKCKQDYIISEDKFMINKLQQTCNYILLQRIPFFFPSIFLYRLQQLYTN